MPVMWERHEPTIKYTPRVVVAPEQFAQIPAVKPDPRHWTERLSKTMLETPAGPRWHIVDVNRHNGIADHVARPVAIRMYQPE